MMLLNDPCLMQGSVEWKELRKTKITSRDAAICMGVKAPFPDKDIVGLYEEKVGIRPEYTPNIFQKKAMQNGHKYEEAARCFFEKKLDVLVFPQVVIRDWQMTSLDGLDLEESVMVEIKVGSKKLMEQAKKGKLPLYYGCQIMHHLCLKPDIQKCHYLVYRPAELDENGHEVTPEDGVILVVERHSGLIEQIQASEWYLFKCIRDRNPPEPRKVREKEELKLLQKLLDCRCHPVGHLQCHS